MMLIFSYIHQANGSLTELIIISNNLSSEAAKSISDALAQNETLSKLDISQNSIGEEGGLAIASMLQVNSTLLRLRLSKCDLTLSSFIALFTVMKAKQIAMIPKEGNIESSKPLASVHSLDISDNLGAIHYHVPSLHLDFVRHLSFVFAVNCTLQTLSLAKLNLDDYDIAQNLSPALEVAIMLTKLDLSGYVKQNISRWEFQT
jgi:predicted transcriptional regulator